LRPDAAAERHRAAADRRDVWVDPAANGMAVLSALVPAVTALAAADRIETEARRRRTEPAETRTLGQLRADLFGEWLLGGSPDAIRPSVNLTVPVLSLLGGSDELATLHGYGPIDLDTARRLTASAPSFRRVLTDP